MATLNVFCAHMHCLSSEIFQNKQLQLRHFRFGKSVVVDQFLFGALSVLSKKINEVLINIEKLKK